jgi:hypothetical protein
MCEALLLEYDFAKRIIIEKNVLQWQQTISALQPQPSGCVARAGCLLGDPLGREACVYLNVSEAGFPRGENRNDGM